MNTSAQAPSRKIAVRSELERLYRALTIEHEHAAGDIHFRSSDLDQVRSLYNAQLFLIAAQTQTVKLLASEASRTEALLAVRELVSNFEREMLDGWSKRHFRASEAMARALTLMVAAETSIRTSA
jgi:hypothetical protein